MIFNVKKAEYISDQKIFLEFEDGEKGTVNLHSYIETADIFAPLNNMDLFKNFAIEFGTLTWDGGSIDMAPEKLYEMATGKKVNLDSADERIAM